MMLHGGQEASTEPVLRRHGSWWRMALLQRTMATALGGHGVELWLVRNRVRGWNASVGQDPDPVRDAREAIGAARKALPGIPLMLVGHSMGGRTACAVAAEPGVVGVCALAPWLPPDSSVAPLAGKTLVVAHGAADRRTSPALSRRFVARAAAAGARATYIEVPGAGHFMLRRIRTWDAVVRNACLSVFDVPRGPS